MDIHMVSDDSTDLRDPHIHMVSDDSMDSSMVTWHVSQHGPQWQYRPQTLTLPSAIAQATDIIIALHGSISQAHQHGLRWQHKPLRST